MLDFYLRVKYSGVETIERHLLDFKGQANCQEDFMELHCLSQVLWTSVFISDSSWIAWNPCIWRSPIYAHKCWFCGVKPKVNSSNHEGETKTYICFFTYASTRAVHLELTQHLDVNSFLLAFQCFAAKRGLLATIISDNAAIFRSSAKEVKRITRSPEVFNHLTENRVVWKFIVEKAPWWVDFGREW